jgi:acetyl-CoA C-acetyltransferase
MGEGFMFKKMNGDMHISVLGVGMTQFGELWDRSLLDLAYEASREALSDASCDPKDIDAVVVANMLSGSFDNQGHLGALVASRLGIHAPSVRVEGACASGGLAVEMGIEKLLSGMAGKVLVVGVEKMTDWSTDVATRALMGASDGQEQAAGITFPGLYALITRAYMEKYGVRDGDISLVAVKNHSHGMLNPKAHFRFPITIDQVLNSPCVASPIKLLDCSPLSDGAAAVVLGSKKRKNGGIYIVGSGQASDVVEISERESLTSFLATQTASKEAFEMAGLEPSDVDVMEVHDCFSIGEVLALEDMGFAHPGEGWVIAGNGECRLGGKRPVNTSGGLKSCGHPVGATGVKQIVELVLQLSHRAKERQVKKVHVGLAHNVGGAGGTSVIHILKA